MNKKNLKNKKAFSLIELSIVILIIGIIVAGVTQSSRLIGAFRVSSARNMTQSSPVAGIKGLLFWYETSLDSSFIDTEEENNTVITTWYDNNPQSTTKYNAYAGQKTNASAITYNLATSSTSGNTSGPTYIRDGLNSIPTLRFTNNASSAYRYMVADPAARTSSAEDLTMFIVFLTRGGDLWLIDRACNNNAATPATAICGSSYNGGNPLFGVGITNGGSIYVQGRNAAGTGIGPSNNFFYDAGYSLVARRKYIFTIERKYGTSWKAYVNGVVTPTTVGDSIGAITMDPIKIGRHADDNNQNGDVDISEIIFFTGPIKAADRVAVEQYLGKKYGINI